MSVSGDLTHSRRYRDVIRPFLIAGCFSCSDAFACREKRGIQPLGGTLNVVLANKNGFVIATDSFATGPGCTRPVDKQKLFRISEQSALAIAGFATYAGQTPFDLDMATILNTRYGDWRSTPKGETVFFLDWVENVLTRAIRRVVAVFSTHPVAATLDLSFVATYARCCSAGFPVIEQSRFVPVGRRTTPVGTVAFSYGLVDKTPPKVASKFIYETEGVDDYALKILREHQRIPDSRLRSFYRAVENDTLDALSISDMQETAAALLDYTHTRTPCVGGATQIGVFPTTGTPTWTQPISTSGNTTLRDSVLWWGASFTTGPGGLPIDQPRDVLQDVEREDGALATQFFVSSLFDGVALVLDDHTFAGNLFRNTRFIIVGISPRLFYSNRVEGTCTVETSSRDLIPPELATRCDTSSRTTKVTDGTVGAPLRWQRSCEKWSTKGECAFWLNVLIPSSQFSSRPVR